MSRVRTIAVNWNKIHLVSVIGGIFLDSLRFESGLNAK